MKKTYLHLNENNRVSGYINCDYTEEKIQSYGWIPAPDDFVFESYFGNLYDSKTDKFVDDDEAKSIRAQVQAERDALLNRKPKVSVTEFKLMFTGTERINLREAAKTDPAVADFFELIDDPRTTVVDLNLTSVQEAIDYVLNYLFENDIVTDVEQRREEILSGAPR